jgi:hypothetical protein
MCTSGTFFCNTGVNFCNLFELQLEEAQEMKTNELNQRMMNISGQIEKVEHFLYFFFHFLDLTHWKVSHYGKAFLSQVANILKFV